MEAFRAFLRKHRYTIISFAAGLVLAILLFTIGFWRTLLLALLAALGINIGVKLDRGERFPDIVQSWSAFWKKVVAIIRSWGK